MPEFHYDPSVVALFEQRFLLSCGEILGAFHRVNPTDRDRLRIDLLSDEAIKSSAIESELLDRSSVQSPMRLHLGLSLGTYASRAWPG